MGWTVRSRCGRARALIAALCLVGSFRPALAATVYVTDDVATTNQVTVLDPDAAKVIGTVTVPGTAKGVAFRPDGTRAYVTLTGNGAALSVIDTATRAVIDTIPFGAPDCDPDVAVDPVGPRVFLSGGPVGRLLTTLDPTTRAPVVVIVGPDVNACSTGLAVSPSGDRVYVISSGTTIAIVDPNGGALVPIDTGQPLAGGIAVSPDGRRVYLSTGSEGQPGSILVLDAAGAPQGSINVGPFIPGPLAVLPGGTSLYTGAFSAASPSIPALLRVAVGQGLVATIPSAAVRGLALNRDATRLYATSADFVAPSGLMVVDTATDTPVGTVPLGSGIRSVAVMPEGCAGGISTACDDGNPCTLDVCQNGTCRHTVVDDGVPCDPCDATRTCNGGACTTVPFACTPSAAVAYVPVFDEDAVAVVDLPSDHRTKITVGVGPWGAAADERGGLAFVTNRGGHSVSLVDGVAGTVRTVELGGTPLGVAADPQSGLAYVANYTRDAVDIVDPASATKVASIDVKNGPVALAVHPAGARLYVSNYLGDTLSVVDVPARQVVATVPVGSGPLGIAVHPDGTRVYVANYADGTIAVVGTAANQRVRTIRVGKRPFGVAVDPTGARVFVSCVGSGTVTVIDAATAAVTAEIAVGDYPFGLAIDPVTQHVGVATGGLAGRLMLLDPVSGTTVSSSSVGAVPVSLGQFIGARPGDCPTRPLQCDDANPATADTCSAAGCRHDPLPAADGAPAGASALADALAAAPAGALGAGDEVTRLEALVASIAAALPPPPAQPSAADRRRALRDLRAVVHLLARLAKQPGVQPAVADRLLDLARGANRLVRRLKLA